MQQNSYFVTFLRFMYPLFFTLAIHKILNPFLLINKTPISSYNKLHECLKDVNVMGVELTLLHALYILCLLTIITFFILRKDTTIICIVFIFLLALTATSSIPLAVSGIFQSFIYAITELLPTILIIYYRIHEQFTRSYRHK